MGIKRGEGKGGHTNGNITRSKSAGRRSAYLKQICNGDLDYGVSDEADI